MTIQSSKAMRISMLCGLIALTGIAAARAEVSTDETGSDQLNTILMAIVDDPDPVPAVWLQYRAIPASRVLNPDGHARGDGLPDLGFHAITDDPDPVPASPVAVWAYNNQSDFDIAFSAWENGAWSATEFLTSATTDERDPRVFVAANGTLHVVWWTVGLHGEIFLVSRAAGSEIWSEPLLVSGAFENAQHPSVGVLDGVVHVAYERDSVVAGMGRDVVVATQQDNGGFAYSIIGATADATNVGPQLHVERGTLWVEWSHATTELGYVKHEPDAGWSSLQTQPLSHSSWIGVEETRKAIRAHVLQ